ncbi:tetratricopeptide repeat protein [Aeromicrobium sp. Sec7.5]|uniref:tetratricopeptide repeat protein n=1 Tax=Aeromicrobium sp. Sec7.5 TaxID=3121276 RepID=UPI002FE4AA63
MSHEGDEAVRLFEAAGEHDSAGREVEAAALYEQAMSLGLDEDRSAQATIQYASTLRNLGRAEEAVVPTLPRYQRSVAAYGVALTDGADEAP